MTATLEPTTTQSPIHFFWTMRPEDGADIFCAQMSEGAIAVVLSAEEILSTEALIASLE